MTKYIYTTLLSILFLSNLWANMPLKQAEELLKNNTAEGKTAGIIIANPTGGHLVLITNIAALKNGSKILSLVAWPPADTDQQMIDIDGDVGHTSLILGHFNQTETSYAKFPAHELQVAFMFAAITYEPIEGEIKKKEPADYMARRLRSYNKHGITFLLTDANYKKIEKIIEHDVRYDHIYHLNCDNCSSWAIDTLNKININFEQLVGPSDATPWEISDFKNDMFGNSNILMNIANRYQGITCANPVDITRSLDNFWNKLGIEQIPLEQESEELDEKQKNFLEKLSHYLGLSLKELELAINSDGGMNISAEGSLTKNIHPNFTALDFGIDADIFAPKDHLRLNKALLSLLRAKFDLSGVRADADALSVIVKESDEGVEVISKWLGLNVQISFYLSENRKIRLLVKGGVSLQSSNQENSAFQLPFDFETAVQFGNFIISYGCENAEVHKLRFELNFSPNDSIFLEGGANMKYGDGPRYKVSLGYRRRY